MKKLKKVAVISLIVCGGIVLNIALAYFTLGISLYDENFEPVYHLMPAQRVSNWLLYHHIEYNGEDYYYAETDIMPDGVIPDFSQKIEVVLADSKCKPYGNDKSFEAYFCENDEEHTYIYYDSACFVNDIDLAVKEMYKGD